MVAAEVAAEATESEVPEPASTSTSVDPEMAARDEVGVDSAELEADGAEEAEGAPIGGAALETAASEDEGVEPAEEAEGAARADEAAEEAAEMTAPGIEIDGEADCEVGAWLDASALAEAEAEDAWAEGEADELAAEETALGTASGVSSIGLAIDQLYPEQHRETYSSDHPLHLATNPVRSKPSIYLD
jgi:hypothetical protein